MSNLNYVYISWKYAYVHLWRLGRGAPKPWHMWKSKDNLIRGKSDLLPCGSWEADSGNEIGDKVPLLSHFASPNRSFKFLIIATLPSFLFSFHLLPFSSSSYLFCFYFVHLYMLTANEFTRGHLIPWRWSCWKWVEVVSHLPWMLGIESGFSAKVVRAINPWESLLTLLLKLIIVLYVHDVWIWVGHTCHATWKSGFAVCSLPSCDLGVEANSHEPSWCYLSYLCFDICLSLDKFKVQRFSPIFCLVFLYTSWGDGLIPSSPGDYVPKAIFKLMVIFLSQSPKCWDYKCAPPGLTFAFCFEHFVVLLLLEI